MAANKSSKKTWWILSIVFGAILILVVIPAIGIWWFYSNYIRPFNVVREAPEEIREARVITGADALSKSEFFHRTERGYLRSIKEAANEPDERERQRNITANVSEELDEFREIAVGQNGRGVTLAGKFGAYILGTSGGEPAFTPYSFEVYKVKVGWFESEQFRNHFDEVQIIDLDGDGDSEYLLSGFLDGMAVFSSEGNLLWKFGSRDIDLNKVWQSEEEREKDKTPTFESAAAGDMDGDGKSDVYVSVEHDGLHAFDPAGKELWFHPDDSGYRHLKVVDAFGTGPVLMGKQEGDIVFLNSQGKIFQRTTIIGFYGDLEFCENSDGRLKQLIESDAGKIKVVDLNGMSVFEADAPLSEIKLKESRKVDIPLSNTSFIDEDENIAYPRATWVRFQPAKPKYLAVTGRFIGLNRSILYVYDENKRLIYQEILPEETYSIAVLPQENGAEAILVGGEKTVWKYNLK